MSPFLPLPAPSPDALPGEFTTTSRQRRRAAVTEWHQAVDEDTTATSWSDDFAKIEAEVRLDGLLENRLRVMDRLSSGMSGEDAADYGARLSILEEEILSILDEDTADENAELEELESVMHKLREIEQRLLP